MFLRRCDVDAGAGKLVVSSHAASLLGDGVIRPEDVGGFASHSFNLLWEHAVVLFQSPMFSRVLVSIFCCGLGHVSALRFTSDCVSVWWARLNASAATVLAGHNSVRDVPVLVTAADEERKDFFVPWASEGEEVAFAQKFVAALTPSFFAQRGTLNLPSVSVHVDTVNMPPLTSATHQARDLVSPTFFCEVRRSILAVAVRGLTAWFCQRWMLSSLRALFQCWNQILLRCQTSKGSRNSGRSTLASLSWDTDLKHFCSCPARRGGSRGPSPSMWLPIR